MAADAATVPLGTPTFPPRFAPTLSRPGPIFRAKQLRLKTLLPDPMDRLQPWAADLTHRAAKKRRHAALRLEELARQGQDLSPVLDLLLRVMEDRDALVRRWARLAVRGRASRRWPTACWNLPATNLFGRVEFSSTWA